MESKRVVVTKADLAANSHADWNAFVHLLASTDYSELGPLQRPAHLIFWYESEVQNGGHLQYFTNQSPDRANETIASLDAIGAGVHARVLERALERWSASARLSPADKLEYSAIALEMEFVDLDQAFHACPLPLIKVLESIFVEHEADFIVREE